MRKLSILLILSLLFLTISISTAQTEFTSDKSHVVVTFFWGQGCPHCADEKPFLEKLKVKYPNVQFLDYEVWYNTENRELMRKMCAEHNFSPSAVPVTFIYDEYIIGFQSEETTGKQIEDKICKCLGEANNETNVIVLPIIGKIDPTKISLPVLAIAIGFLDGFNPCSMWVLTFLLTLLLYTRSRRNVFIVSGIFIFTSALIYFLFMTAWLNFFILVGYGDILRLLVGVVAVVAGAINVKEFFFFGKGISLTIAEKDKPGLYDRMRKIVHLTKSEQLLAVILSTIVLAVTVNFVELLCTLGFPAIFTKVLTLHKLSFLEYYAYIALYCLVYVIPLIAIVGLFTLTMEKKKFTEQHGKILKLIGGVLMLLLGILLLVKPELLMFG